MHLEPSSKAIAEEANASQSFYALDIIWASSIPFVRLSILLLYNRAFRLRYLRISLYIIGTFSTFWALIVIIVYACQCRPIQYFWDRTLDGSCINTPLFLIIASATDVASSFVLLALPLRAIWKMKTIMAQKIILTGIFWLGLLYVNSPRQRCELI